MSKNNYVGNLSFSTTVVTRFLLLCAVLLAIPAVAAAQGSVTLQPDHGPVGTGVKAKGTGWIPGEVVYAFFDQQQLSVAPETVDDKGEFTLDFCVPDLPPGPHPTYFTSIGGLRSGPIFTITAGSPVTCQTEIPTCKPAFFIGLRGSGEPATRTREVQTVDPVTGTPVIELQDLNDSLGPTVGTFYEAFEKEIMTENVDFHGVSYPAAMPPTKLPASPLDWTIGSSSTTS